MKTKTFLRNISPFNNSKDMPAVLYGAKKMLAFFFIYAVSALLGEALIIGGMTAMGYDPLNGVMPTGHLAELLPYYGFAVFFLVAILYCKFVEKRSIAYLGFKRKGTDCFFGAALAVLLLATIVGVCCVTGVMSFSGFVWNTDKIYLGLLFLAFLIQSMAEETICRGFLLKTLCEKTSAPFAIFVSSTAFAMPHLSTLFEADAKFSAVGIINLYLVSIIFSLLFMLRSNIYIVGGLHCVWNFVLYGAMGLSVSGSSANETSVVRFGVNGENLLSGGAYGLEASLVTTAVLALTTIILVRLYGKRRLENGL